MSSIPQTSGIYKIVHLTTGRVYIGSAAKLSKRYGEHWRDLRANRHHNSHLQRAWNKYGQESFSFVVIEEVLLPFLVEREQYWIDKLHACDRRKGFNQSPTAGSPLGIKRSNETRQKLSALKKGVSFSEDFRKMRSEVQKINWSTPGYRENFRAKEGGTWIVTDPSGLEHCVVGLRPFCEAHGLDTAHMSEVARGHKRSQHKGWKCRRVDTEV